VDQILADLFQKIAFLGDFCYNFYMASQNIFQKYILEDSKNLK
jgi:hypothetical protein